ncbi:MAG: Stp1/IreP family PP2C-type Ser/Thr phosphatase [Gammaproteobacteria bacterium]|nr:Stp1/IreP family PP2C-type Ser/Thr phosphatase [Gammaproteobacteria bacterium]
MGKLDIAAATDPGQVRTNNEDCIATNGDLGLVVLADGMGGHQAGEVASGLAVDLIMRHMNYVFENPGKVKLENGLSLESQSIGDAIRLANSAVHETSQERPECAGMGSTVVAAAFHGNKISIGHVGDSRLYRLRKNTLQQLTVDHSVVQELLSRGLISAEEARTAYNKNLVTRALGVDAKVEPEIREFITESDDIYLLCSDGLNDVLDDNQIRDLMKSDNSNLEPIVHQMIEVTNSKGGPDNISIILIRTDGNFTRNQTN